MNDKIFQEVFDIIYPVLPAYWKKMVLYVAYTDGSYSMKFYTMDEKNIYTDCFKQKNADRMQLIRIFTNIDKVLSVGRKQLENANKWTVMTMIVDNNGDMKTEFDYTDINENAILYEQEWKEKYIK